MKTMKLRILQQPSRLGALLGSLIMSQNWVPAEAPRVTDRSELPSVLQKLVAKNREGRRRLVGLVAALQDLGVGSASPHGHGTRSAERVQDSFTPRSQGLKKGDFGRVVGIRQQE